MAEKTTGFSGARVHMPGDPTTMELWRVAVLVYRQVRATGPDKEWLQAAAAAGAVMALRPEMGWKEASRIATEAVAGISVRWPDWMWKGEGEEPDWGGG